MAAGVEDARDVASLTVECLSAIIGGPCSPALLELRARGLAELEVELAAPLVGAVRDVFPSSRRATSAVRPPPLVHPRAAVAQGPAKATWKAPDAGTPSTGPCAEAPGHMAERNAAAAAVLVILQQHQAHSSFAQEIHDAQQAGRANEWYSLLQDVLAKRFEAQGMWTAVRAWRRWTRWRSAQNKTLLCDPARPMPLDLATWLGDEAERGRTVQKSLIGSLRWLYAHVGLRGLPLDSPLISGLGVVVQTVENHATELPVKVWSHFLHLARNAPGSIAVLSMVIVYVTVTCLRFRHAQRHRFLDELCNDTMLVGEVSRGKGRRRAPFRVAAPLHVEPGDAMFLRLRAELRRHCPDATFLVPDLAGHRGRALDGGVPLVANPMSYHKFMATVRALAMAPPLALSWEEAARVTSYSLRRKLPSTADRLRLPMETRAALGDWRDPIITDRGAAPQPREPMSVLYSAARLESSVRARLECLASLRESMARDGVSTGADDAGSRPTQCSGPPRGRPRVLRRTLPRGPLKLSGLVPPKSRSIASVAGLRLRVPHRPLQVRCLRAARSRGWHWPRAR